MPLYRGILISSKRNFEKNALSEMHFTLTNEIGIDKSKVKASLSGISGLGTIKLHGDIDVVEVAQKLISLEDEKQYFQNVVKFRPIEYVISTDLEEISKFTQENLKDRVNGSYKIEIGKRHTNLRSKDIIESIAPHISNQVSLDNPNTVFLVEVIADKFGISIIDPSLIYTCKIVDEQENAENNWFL